MARGWARTKNEHTASNSTLPSRSAPPAAQSSLQKYVRLRDRVRCRAIWNPASAATTEINTNPSAKIQTWGQCFFGYSSRQWQVTDPDGRRAMYALVGLVTLVGIGICGLDVTMQWVAGGVDWPRWCIMSLGSFLIGWYLLAACLLEWKWFFNAKAMRRMRAGGHDLFARMFYVGISSIFFLISFSTSASSIVRAVRWSAVSMASGRSAGQSHSDPESRSEQRTRQATMEIVAIATAAPIRGG